MQSYDITFCNNPNCPKYSTCFRNFDEFREKMSENQLVSVANFETCIAENYKYFIEKEN